MIQLQGRLCGVPFFELVLWHRKGKREWPVKLGQRILGQDAPAYLHIPSVCWPGTPRLFANSLS